MIISNLKIGTSYFFTPLEEFAKENIRYLKVIVDGNGIRPGVNLPLRLCRADAAHQVIERPCLPCVGFNAPDNTALGIVPVFVRNHAVCRSGRISAAYGRLRLDHVSAGIQFVHAAGEQFASAVQRATHDHAALAVVCHHEFHGTTHDLFVYVDAGIVTRKFDRHTSPIIGNFQRLGLVRWTKIRNIFPPRISSQFALFLHNSFPAYPIAS